MNKINLWTQTNNPKTKGTKGGVNIKNMDKSTFFPTKLSKAIFLWFSIWFFFF
jgi:hypothetical protein